MTTKIELLYFEDCPNWRKGLELLKNIFDDLRITQEIHLVKIENEEEAKRRKFSGSPSFFINGQDLFPNQQENYFLGCRVYPTSRGFQGVPEYDILRSAIQKALGL
ncbi:MAG: DUF2703 domain-containing protein [Chloroflexota bacterium]|nr:MAG: hypothetical protein KatS3mg047_0710 [Bellilinea sp.]